MKSKLILSAALVLIGFNSYSQTPNPVLTAPRGKITFADTTALKIQALQDRYKNLEAQNNKLKEDIAALKNSLSALTTKFSEVQKDNFASKVSISGLNNTLTTLQTSYTNFTTVLYPAHFHILHGVAGNSVEKNGPVIMNVGNGDLGKMVKWAKKTSGVATDD